MRRVTFFQRIASPSQRSSTISAASFACPNSPGSAYSACERTNTVLITEGQPEILSAGYLRDLAEVEKLVGKAKDAK